MGPASAKGGERQAPGLRGWPQPQKCVSRSARESSLFIIIVVIIIITSPTSKKFKEVQRMSSSGPVQRGPLCGSRGWVRSPPEAPCWGRGAGRGLQLD